MQEGPAGGPVKRLRRAREGWVSHRETFRQARDRLAYVPAFGSLHDRELELLFDCAGVRAPVALRRAARFLFRERHLRAVGGDIEAGALLVVALALLQFDPVRGPGQLESGSARRQRALSAWWWSATLVRRPPPRTAEELANRAQHVVDWLQEEGRREDMDPPEIARGNAHLVHPRQGVAAAGYGSGTATARLLESLLLRAEPIDFVTGEPIVGLLLVERAPGGPKRMRELERVERHHVFPRAFLTQRRVSREHQDQWANIALISGATNGWISDRSPSRYVRELDTKFGVDEVDRILETHLLSGSLMRQEFGFDDQIRARAERLGVAAARLVDPRYLGDVVRGTVEKGP